MITAATILGHDANSLTAAFQDNLLTHWNEIRNGHRFPLRRAFRPQTASRHLPRVAMVSIDADKAFHTRVVGSDIVERLHLDTSTDPLIEANDPHTRDLLIQLLGTARDAAMPVYLEGVFSPAAFHSIAFTALVLPFSMNDSGESLDVLMLAFDFSRPHTVDFSTYERRADDTSFGAAI
ncbi:PAS domain-containing protein [Gimibacter soli]|uniref:PAS domain-containing protein n=1 Tax=Gimibacter soli TaxID=3024400 RepID=A0AAE9XTM3_9PROT|nr:PAS domain-containing protein [Gimibacter soli]WCL53133.1 PAS domain-containing protein [Gimibacter soli]